MNDRTDDIGTDASTEGTSDPATQSGKPATSDPPEVNTLASGGGDDQCTVAKGSTSIPVELDALRKARDAARGKDELAPLENRLRVLEGVERDYPATKKAYNAAHDQLALADKNLKDHFDSEKSQLETRLGPSKTKEVADFVNAQDTMRASLEKSVQSAKDKLGRAASPQESHNQAIKDRTAELDAWKNLAATVTAHQAEQTKLREEIVKARQVGHYGLAYGLLLIALKKRASHATRGPRLIAPDKLHNEFHVAGEKLAAAQNNLARAERQLETDRATLAAANKDLDEHQKNAEATLLADLVDIEPEGDERGSPTPAATPTDKDASIPDESPDDTSNGGGTVKATNQMNGESGNA